MVDQYINITLIDYLLYSYSFCCIYLYFRALVIDNLANIVNKPAFLSWEVRML